MGLDISAGGCCVQARCRVASPAPLFPPCRQVATKGVTVNAVCPGYVMTELIEKQLANQAKTRGIPKASTHAAGPLGVLARKLAACRRPSACMGSRQPSLAR